MKKLEITAIYYQVSIIPRITNMVYDGGGAKLVGKGRFLYIFMNN
jgi:hypothetical protein